MRRLLTLAALLFLLAGVPIAAASSADAAPTHSWNDRAGIDIHLPSGWRLLPCDGDAPFLCAYDPAGDVGGTVLLSVTDLGATADISRAGVDAKVASFHETLEEDRLATCPTGYRYEQDPLQTADVGGVPGYRFGFTLRNGQGGVTERAVIHLALTAGRELAVNTSFTDPAGCPGKDHERIEFDVDVMDQVLPHLDGLVAQIAPPSEFSVGPACPPRGVPAAGFSDTADNAHRALIDCVASLGVARGFSDDTYRPAQPITRAHAAALVGRMLLTMGEELPPPPPNRFTDLRGNPHAPIVNQLAAAGVVKGTSATTFDPGRAVTRAEAATLVVRAYELTLRQGLYDARIVFDDVDAENVHAATISRAASNGLVHGRSDGGYDPGDDVRRDELAAIVGRAVNRISWTRTVRGIPGATAGRA